MTFKEFISEKENKENKELRAELNDIKLTLKDADIIKDEVIYSDGVYIKVVPSEMTQNSIFTYIAKYIAPQYPDFNTDLHCTLIFSKKEHKGEILDGHYKYTATASKFSLFGEENDTLVLELNSDELIQRNKALVKEYRFISDFDEYKPHMTLAYGVKNIDINSLPLPDFIIELENEVASECNLDYKKDKKDNLKESQDTQVDVIITKVDANPRKLKADFKVITEFESNIDELNYLIEEYELYKVMEKCVNGNTTLYRKGLDEPLCTFKHSEVDEMIEFIKSSFNKLNENKSKELKAELHKKLIELGYTRLSEYRGKTLYKMGNYKSVVTIDGKNINASDKEVQKTLDAIKIKYK